MLDERERLRWQAADFVEVMVMRPVSRRTFLKGVGVGSLAATVPTLMTAKDVLATDGMREFVFVSFSQAPTTASGVKPRIGMQGAGTFKADPGWVKGGGSYVLFNQASPMPRTLLASGLWEATEFVSYNHGTLSDAPTYGTIQPGILTMKANIAGLGSGLTLALICNVGAVPLSVGQDEGWKLMGTSFGDFEPLDPVVGITHLSIPGIAVDRGA